MEIKDIQEKWESFKNQREYQQRLDSSHPLNFFVGIDSMGCEELILITKEEPKNIRSTFALKVEKSVRKDGNWATRIALQDSTYLDIFSKLCLDMVEVSKNADSEENGMELVIQRYISWIKIFANINTILSLPVLKGLMGELSFFLYLKEKNIKIDEIIDSWQGPLGADRDFIFLDQWFEIKTIPTGKTVVTISSLNQLETTKNGYLVKYDIDKTSKNDPNAISVASLVEQVRKILTANTVDEFERKLIEVGYIDKLEYKDIYFTISSPEFFYVDNEFPRLITKNVPKEIVSANYDLSLVGISSWKKSEEEVWN